MKYLTVARHGDFNNFRNLNDLGIEQMNELAWAIYRRSEKNIIISSNVPYAKESASKLALVLGIGETHESRVLAGGPAEEIHKLVSDYRESADGLILVTHVEFTTSYLEHFTEIEFGKGISLSKVGKGEAYFLDLPERKLVLLPSCENCIRIE